MCSSNQSAISIKYQNKLDLAIDQFFNRKLKGILFEVYISLGDIEAYEKVNERSKKYLLQLNTSISEEGYVLREKTLTLIDILQARFEVREMNKKIKNYAILRMFAYGFYKQF